MAPPPAPSSRSRDSLLFSSFSLPPGWGRRKPMAFCQGMDAHVASEPKPNAAADQPQIKLSQSPAKGAAAEETPEAPWRHWNLRDRKACRDYRAEDARPHRKIGNTEALGKKSHGFSVPLAKQEIDADFVAITGQSPPRKPHKRPKSIQRKIENLCPGSEVAGVAIGTR